MKATKPIELNDISGELLTLFGGRYPSTLFSNGEQLRALRLSHEGADGNPMTQKELARLSGVPQSVIAKAELGSEKATETLFALAQCLNADLSDVAYLPAGTSSSVRRERRVQNAMMRLIARLYRTRLESIDPQEYLEHEEFLTSFDQEPLSFEEEVEALKSLAQHGFLRKDHDGSYISVAPTTKELHHLVWMQEHNEILLCFVSISRTPQERLAIAEKLRPIKVRCRESFDNCGDFIAAFRQFHLVLCHGCTFTCHLTSEILCVAIGMLLVLFKCNDLQAIKRDEPEYAAELAYHFRNTLEALVDRFDRVIDILEDPTATADSCLEVLAERRNPLIEWVDFLETVLARATWWSAKPQERSQS